MGHGHVIPNKDGSRARCGGPALCGDCAMELASLQPDGNIHTIPSGGKKHYESSKCWCHPKLNDDFTNEGGKKHFVHNEFQ